MGGVGASPGDGESGAGPPRDGETATGHILVIAGHPDLHASNANRTILEVLERSGLDLSVRRLAALYPAQRIDVEAEQAALLAADLVVLQFPLYWYSVPALLKHWIDDVLTYGFAYGRTGDKLKGKGFLASATASSPRACYQTQGYNNYTLEDLLLPVKQTALMAQMLYQAPVLSYENLYIPGVIGTAEDLEARGTSHGQRLVERIRRFQADGPEIPLYRKLW